MIEERYCSYEVSNLFQEKGFNQECFAKYAKEACTERYYDDYRERMLSWTIRPGELIIPSIDRDSYEVYGVMIPAPTHQMACDWIRETHNIFICIIPSEVGAGVMDYTYVLYKIDAKNFYFEDLGIQSRVKNISEISYEKTVEAAIKYCLENLIE